MSGIHWLTYLGIFFIAIGTYFTYLGQQINSDKSASKNQDELISKIKEQDNVIKKFNFQLVEMADKQIQIYDENLNKILRGEIAMPPDFFVAQQKALRASENNLNEWANDVSQLRGKEQDYVQLTSKMIEVKSAQIEGKIKLNFLNFKELLKQCVKALNDANTLNGEINLSFFDENYPVVQTIHNNQNLKEYDLANVSFPVNNLEWKLTFRPFYYSPSLVDNKGLNANSLIVYVKGKDVSVYIVFLEDGKFRFLGNPPFQKGWPEDIYNQIGDIDFLKKVIKAMFERQVMFLPK